MISLIKGHFNLEKRVFIILTIAALLLLSKEGFTQPPDPPRPIVVTTSQDLSFGAFTFAASTGTVTITPAGFRSATGSGVVLLNLGTPTAAIFSIIANAGTLITITFGPVATLLGSPSGTLTLHVNTSDPESPFITTKDYPDPTLLYIGGTLTVGNSSTSPPGTYTGSFDITLNQD